MATSSSPDREALRREIQAAIAAGRELDPAMDMHLADSALSNYEQEQRARGLTPIVPTAPPAPGAADMIARILPSIVGAAIFIAVLIVRPELWWVIFFIGPMIGGWWGYGHRGHREEDPQERSTKQTLRETKRRLKIQQLEAEIQQLKAGKDPE